MPSSNKRKRSSTVNSTLPAADGGDGSPLSQETNREPNNSLQKLDQRAGEIIDKLEKVTDSIQALAGTKKKRLQLAGEQEEESYGLIKFVFNVNQFEDTTKIISEPVKLGEANWQISVEATEKKDAMDKYDLSIFLQCESLKENYRCDAKFVIHLLGTNESLQKSLRHKFLDQSKHGWAHIMDWNSFSTQLPATNGGQAEVYVHLWIKNVAYEPDKLQMANFSDSTPFYSDCVLLVDGDRLHVNKGLLSVHSTAFKQMFTVDPETKDKSEIVIDDVGAGEFIQLLQAIYPLQKADVISANNVEGLLKLAGRFEVEGVLKRCDQFVKQMSVAEGSIPKKLLLAQKFNLTELMNACVAQFKTIEEIKKLQEEPEYAQLDDKTTRLLLESISRNG